jgi:glycosyltransferase involved in cell wall biosynthesis
MPLTNYGKLIQNSQKSSVLRIAHLIPYLGRANGGPVTNLAACTQAQAAAGCEVFVFGTSRPEDGPRLGFDPSVRVFNDEHCRWGAFRRSPELWRMANGCSYDLVHSHGMWTDVNRLAMRLSRRRNVPHLLNPCGMLAPGALRHHAWKKAPVRLWFQDRALREAQCLQAQSALEYEHIRRFGMRNPVAIIPAAVPGLPGTGILSAGDFRSRYNILAGRKLVLYLGRLHPVKGLGRLITAWSGLGAARTDWLLVLAGPDEGGYKATLQNQIEQAGCRSSVVFTGPLDDAAKWSALADACLFVMPSDFENFGISIAEAMLSGLPIITTTGTPWKEVSSANAGWWVAPQTEALVGALREALAMSDGQRQAMGRRAADMAERFRPERVAEDLIRVYRWLLGTGPRPEYVV